ncbi:hypothetical protein B0H11DRAFT_1935739 [Mycena galericulata]|nr:hypothetical protein B0H11DRAFT_1935739 [Mycena galericulata]
MSTEHPNLATYHAGESPVAPEAQSFVTMLSRNIVPNNNGSNWLSLRLERTCGPNARLPFNIVYSICSCQTKAQRARNREEASLIEMFPRLAGYLVLAVSGLAAAKYSPTHQTITKSSASGRDPFLTCKTTSWHPRMRDSLYDSEQELSLKYFPDNAESQRDAQQFLATHQLDKLSRQRLESRWNIQWSTSWPSSGKTCRRTLFQWQNPFDFTGCLAHAELTEFEQDGTVKAIVGHLEHNPACQASSMKRFPAVPLHPHMKNIEMLTNKEYREMDVYHPETANFRYKFLPSGSRHLYQLYNRVNGIDVTYKPQYNIHNWLDPESAHYRPEIHQAIFHYAARSERGERLKVCIATDMKKAAWKYAHHSQLILDGTVDVCSSRMLLFIAMGIDEDGKGVPLAFFLFPRQQERKRHTQDITRRFYGSCWKVGSRTFPGGILFV